MLTILTVTFPFFALVLCGYVATRRQMLPQAAIPGLNIFVLYFALPCMLFRFGATTPLQQLLDLRLAAIYLVCALTIVSLVIVVSFKLHRGLGWDDAAFGALVGAFPNTGFMGVPLLIALLGQRAAGPAIVTILVDLIITSSLCIALSRLDGAGAAGARQAAVNALRGAASNPMPWAIVCGGVVSVLGLQVPKPLFQTLSLLADAASPVALFTIGAVLARQPAASMQAAPPAQGMPSASGEASAATPVTTPGRFAADEWAITVIKLAVHPALVACVGWLAVHATSWSMEPIALTTIVLVAALPSASNVSILTEKFGANTARVARVIMLTTVVAFLSFSAIVHVMLGDAAGGR